jgi:tetratricopeptide (TPR) repeat protein
VPYLRNPNFTGRDELLDELHSKLEHGRTALTAVRGMGGVGKTQLALEYAYRHAGDFDLVWWLRAEEPATLLEDYAALAQPLGLGNVGERDLAVVANAVCQELARRDRWLLVFDNATGPDDVRTLLPRAGVGRVLITSRNPSWPFAVPLDVPVLRREAAIRFLLEQTKQHDRDAADALANELGDLPLALAQAAAYVTETGVGLAGYLDLFRTRRSELWAEEKPPEGYPATVGTTMAADRLRSTEPLALDLLSLCAFLAPEAIPRRLLSEHHAALPAELGDAAADPLRLNRLVGLLRRYSLVDVTGEGLTFHRLVQAATRDALTDHAMRRWLTAAVALMNAGFPYVEDDPATWTPSGELLSHALATAGYAERFVRNLPDTARLLNEAASFLETRAEFDRARAAYRRALELAEEALGPGDPTVATYVNNLGHVLKAQADLSGARACFERALAIDEAAFGFEHPNVASDVNNLGLVLRAQADLAGALACFDRALRIFESHFGSEHPDVATIVNNRGTVLQDLGNLAEARACYERALVIDEAVFGLEHPNVAIRINNLGSALQDLGDVAGARAYFARALSIFEKFLPTDHPHVTKTRSHLQIIAEEEAARAKE